MSQKPLNVLVMAAGLGTRMKSNRAKVLHELDGSPLIAHVVRAARALNPQAILVVVGHQAEQVERAAIAEVGDLARSVLQAQQRGTGDAVESARSELEDSDSLVLILSGDVPLIKPETLKKLIEHHNTAGAACTILSVRLENPTGYGRIIRNQNGSFQRIVEHRDATEEQRQVKERGVPHQAIQAGARQHAAYAPGHGQGDDAQHEQPGEINAVEIEFANHDAWPSRVGWAG